MERLTYAFYHRHALEVAPELVGKLLVYNGKALRISETEAYCGTADTACHAHKGRTPRTEVLYADAGTVYVYLCYGVHWLMNIITGDAEDPQGGSDPGLSGSRRAGKADPCPGHHRSAKPGQRRDL